MKIMKVLMLVAGLVMATGSVAEARQAMGVHDKIVDGFMFLVDNSGSMMMDHKSTGIQKIEMAKRIMTKIDSNVPDLGYQAAVTLFSPNESVVAPMTFDEMAMNDAIQNIGNKAKIYGRMTNFEKNFYGIANMISEMNGPKAVFLISDGMENIGVVPAQAAQALYAANPEMVLHVISVADTAMGMENLKAVAALHNKSQFIDGANLIYSDDAAYDLVSSALYEKTIPSQMVTGTTIVLFDTAKHAIKPKHQKRLDEIAAIMVTRPDLKLYIEGHADIRGTDAYNQGLSERRCNAVRDYLASRGVKADQMIAKGKGETDYFPAYEYDRRVDVMIIWQ